MNTQRQKNASASSTFYHFSMEQNLIYRRERKTLKNRSNVTSAAAHLQPLQPAAGPAALAADANEKRGDGRAATFEQPGTRRPANNTILITVVYRLLMKSAAKSILILSLHLCWQFGTCLSFSPVDQTSQRETSTFIAHVTIDQNVVEVGNDNDS